MMNAWKKFRRTLSAFRVAQAGNVAITFAFASLPIIGFVGAAVDYSRANSVKAAMQTALDSTALMLAKEAASDTEDQLKTNANKYFKALFTRSGSQGRRRPGQLQHHRRLKRRHPGDSRPRCGICEGSWV